MNRRQIRHAAAAGCGLLLILSSVAWAQTAPTLGIAGQFGCLGNSGVTGATGSGVEVEGDVGSYPTATIINFPPSYTVPPWIVHYTADGVVQQARSDADAAYANLFGQTPATPLAAQLAGQTLTSGIYSFETEADIATNGVLTLDGGGVFVFQVGSALTANVGSRIEGTANPCDVYWQIGTSATLNGTEFWGTVIADASITLGSGANLIGRALAGRGATGAVTMSGSGGNSISDCASLPSTTCPDIDLSPDPLPEGTVGVAYSQQIAASGGTGPYVFSVASGTLPAGLTLTSGGLLSGTPSTAGSSVVTIRAVDSEDGCLGETIYTIVINAAPAGPEECPPIVLSPATLPAGMVGAAYSQQITASGGTGPYTFAVTSGTLPAGLTLTSGGLLSGTPTGVGSSVFTIGATDQNDCPGLVTYTLLIRAADISECPPISLSPATLPEGSVGVAYSQQITASGGTGPYTFAVTSGTLPAGLTLSPGGLLSGTPTSAVSATLTIEAIDANGCPGEIVYTSDIEGTGPAQVPTLPQLFVLLLAIGLGWAGYSRLRSRARTA
jgi:hypothetical protein